MYILIDITPTLEMLWHIQYFQERSEQFLFWGNLVNVHLPLFLVIQSHTLRPNIHQRETVPLSIASQYNYNVN